MLKPKLLNKILNESCTKGIKSSLLLNLDSSLVAFGVEESEESEKYVKLGTVYSALASFTWSSYEKIGNGLNDELDMILFECEGGKLIIVKVANMLLCLVGDKECMFGLMRTKALALHRHLYPSLNKLQVEGI